jgi:hypothetical protein
MASTDGTDGMLACSHDMLTMHARRTHEERKPLDAQGAGGFLAVHGMPFWPYMALHG